MPSVTVPPLPHWRPLADIVDRETRSRMMAGIRGRDTRPELLIRRGLHANGYRYRLHDRKLPGSPDLVFASRRAVVFVHGCFWHGHDCPLFRWPRTRENFWRDKIGANRVRDASSRDQLATQGWRSLVIWECALKGKGSFPIDEVIEKIGRWLANAAEDADIRGRD